MNRRLLRVAADSLPALVAGAIAGQIREHQQSEVQAIGMVATYGMFKAVITAQKFVKNEGIRLVCMPEFIEIDIDGQRCTAMRITVHHADNSSLLMMQIPEQEQ
ncbi:MAG: stage V sporulation protein S [Chloroflexi bacterium]|nr:stage V sporulation protein S [Chloroflexota bacterium]